MRIIILSDRYLPDNSGTSMRPARLVQPLIRSGKCEVHIATFMKPLMVGKTDTQLLPYELVDGVHVHRFQSDLNMIRGLITLHRRNPYDLVHTRGIRYSLYAQIIKQIRKCPKIFELNTLPTGGLLRSILLQYALHSSDRIIVLSEYAKYWAVNEMRVRENKIDIVLNGVDLESFSSEVHCAREDVIHDLGDKITIGYCGSFFEWQGVLDIVRCAAIVSRYCTNVRFLMVGSGPDLEKTVDLAKELGVRDKFIFAGSVPPEDVPALIGSMDIFLIVRPISYLKSRLAIPLKLLEAMAMGKAVVVTPVQGLSEMIDDHATGLIAGSSVESITSAVLELVKDNDLRQRLGQAARHVVETEYTWEKMSESLWLSYCKALE